MPKKRIKPGTRRVEKRFFILCEGMKDKSEYSYFKKLIADLEIPPHRALVRLVPTVKNTGRELVREAAALLETKDDAAWVAYDMDGYTKHAETFALARAKRVKIAFSAICFEYWVLLHFGYTSRPFDKCDDLLAFLRSAHSLDCSKSQTVIYDQIKDRTMTALANAKRLVADQLRSNPAGTPIYEMNPYTNINELIEELEAYR